MILLNNPKNHINDFLTNLNHPLHNTPLPPCFVHSFDTGNNLYIIKVTLHKLVWYLGFNNEPLPTPVSDL